MSGESRMSWALKRILWGLAIIIVILIWILTKALAQPSPRVDCLSQRATFKEFYSQYYYGSARGHWAGDRWEEIPTVNKRVLDATASYIDYAEAYRDQCGRK